jgi:hypothetical protein
MTTDEPLHISGKNAVQTGQVPTTDDLYWIGAMRTVFIESMRTTHASAVVIIAASLVGWGAIVVAILFGNGPLRTTGSLVWLLPLAIWTATIVWALRVLSIRRYRYFTNSPDSSHQAIVRIARRKYRHLYGAVVLWIAGVVAFALTFAYQLLAGG